MTNSVIAFICDFFLPKNYTLHDRKIMFPAVKNII